MKIFSFILFFILSMMSGYAENTVKVLFSPDNNVTFSAYEVGGLLKYKISYKGKPVILESQLGIDGWSRNLEIERIDSSSVHKTWHPVYGERAVVEDC